MNKKLNFPKLSKISFSLIRLTITSSVAFSSATLLNFLNYTSYWNGTIFAVQTVDFNILSHTLPTKLSYALQKKDVEEIQNTLDSNFGLFGIVVTDCKTEEKECPNQKFWYSSKSNRNWKKLLSLNELSQHPYDLLKNPIPLNAENQYTSTRSINRINTGKNNTGEIIGRVYYIRGVPPTFQQDYLRWLQNPFSTSGAHKYYSLTTFMFLFGGFAFSSILELVLYRRRKTQEQLKQQIRLLQYQLDGEQQNNTLLQFEIQELGAELEQQKQELEIKYQEQFFLETYIQDLQDRSQLNEKKIAGLQTQLEQAKLQTELDDHAIARLEQEIANIQQREIDTNSIAQMQQELLHLREQREKNHQNFNLLQNQLDELNSQRKLDEETINKLELELVNVQEEKEIYTKSYDELQEQMSLVEQQKIKVENLVNQVQTELDRTKTLNQYQITINDSLSQNIARLEEELTHERQARQREEQLIKNLKKQLQKYTHQEEEDNLFEKQIKQYLIDNIVPQFPVSIILSSFDVASGRQASRVVDIIIILNSYCVVTIEAKKYKGKIHVDGNPRTNKWHCYYNTTKKVIIQSASFLNPYKQVWKYSSSISKTLEQFTKGKYTRIRVYGLIVFPQELEISEVKNKLGIYYQTVNINDLTNILQVVAKESSRNIEPQSQALSTKQIENILLGKPVSLR